jgi:hypothetical protein
MAAFAMMGAVLSLAACGGQKPSWTPLPSPAEIPYQVSARTFKDGSYADQPFQLRINSKSHPERGGLFISSGQCKNVTVAQTSDTIYVFYDQIVLNEFSSIRYGEEFPTPLLCDLHHPYCSSLLKQIAMTKGALSEVCTYR